jgi:hypothetical protein
MKQNSLEQIGDVKTVVSGDRLGFVSYLGLQVKKLTVRSTRPNSSILEWLTEPSLSSMEWPLSVADSR